MKNTFKDRQRETIRNRGVNFKSLQRDSIEGRATSKLTKLSDSEFADYLEKIRRDDQKFSAEQQQRTPTFFEMKKINLGENVDLTVKTTNFDFRKTPSPNENIQPTNAFKNLSLKSLDKAVVNEALKWDKIKQEQSFKNFAGSFLAGSGDIKNSRIYDPNNPPPITGGALGFLYGEITKQDSTEKAERYDKLLSIGTAPKRALDIVEAWGSKGLLPIGLTEKERKTMRNYSIKKGIFIALELSDLLLLGKPVNTAMKSIRLGAKAEMFAKIAKTKGMVEARKLMKIEYPALAGTEGLDELISIARRANKYDSWSKVIRNGKEANELIKKAKGTARVVPDTEVQKIFYTNNVPVIRGGSRATARETVGVRNEVVKVLEGKKNGLRLSNDDVLASEIKAGSLDFGTKADDLVDVYALDNVSLRGDKLGARVSLTEKLAGSGKKLQAKVDDLVRLDDGTFVIAPASVVQEGLSPSVKLVRANVRAKVVKLEKIAVKKEANRVADAIAEQKKVAEATARAERVATEAKISQIRKAKEILEKGAVTKALKSSEITKKASEARNANTASEKEYRASRKVVTDKMKAPLKVIDKSKGAIEKLKATANRKIESIRNKKRLTPKEKAKQITRVRKERDSAIARVKKAKLQAKKVVTKLREDLKTVDKTGVTKEEVSKMNAEITAKARTEKAELSKTFTEAKVKAKETLSEAKKDTPKPASANAPVEEIMTTAGKEARVVSSNKPITSSGEKLKSQMSETIKKKIFGGLPVPEYNKMNLEATQKVAIKMVVEDPASIYSRFIDGIRIDEAPVAHLGQALLESPYVKGIPIREEAVGLMLQPTRAAQELVAFKILNNWSAPQLIQTLKNSADRVLTKRGVNLADEVAKIEKEMGVSLGDVKVASEQDVMKFVKENLC